MTGPQSSRRLHLGARLARAAAAVVAERGRSAGRTDGPEPDRLVRNVHPTCRHHLLNLAQAQVEPGVEPENLRNDVGRKRVAFVAEILCLHRHSKSPPDRHRSDRIQLGANKLAMPPPGLRQSHSPQPILVIYHFEDTAIAGPTPKDDVIVDFRCALGIAADE